jgi:hypothetical protein
MRKYSAIAFIFLLFNIFDVSAQAPYPAGSRAAALADASLLISDVWSETINK